MAEPVWGQLKKAQDDETKIDTAIAEAIAAHNDDSDSHIGEGKSLNTHKSQEVVDHPAASIVDDKIKEGELRQIRLSKDELQVYTCFESLDGWQKSAQAPLPNVLGVMLQTGGSINTICKMTAEPGASIEANPYDKDTFFQTGVRLGHTTNQLIYFVTGGVELDNTDENFGFKIENGTLYAIVVKEVAGERTEFATEITGITLINLNIYKAVLDVAPGNIKFYVNGVLKHTESTNLPEVNTLCMFTYFIKNSEASNKLMGAAYLNWSRKI